MNNALNGAHVLVTRPEHQAAYLCQLIEQQGGVAVRFPTLQIVGIDASLHNHPANKSIATNSPFNLSNYCWLIFTSANAVNFALKANGGKIAALKGSKIAAIGQATARELELSGLHGTLIPKAGFDSESLLAMPQMQDIAGQEILIIRGHGGREELATVLSGRGANIQYWEVYKRVVPDIDSSEVVGLLEQGLLDVIIITSYEALQNLLAMLGEIYKKSLATIPLVVISDRIKRLAIEMGFTQVAVAECPSDSAIVDTVRALINGEKSDRID